MKRYLLLLVIFFAIGTIVPLFSSGFFPIHDNAQVARVVVMNKALSDGMFPVRWSEYLGYNYGYPIFNFYAPLAYYGGGLIQFVVGDPLLATKAMMGLAMILAGVSMYFLARSVWGELGGLVAAIFYLYFPYHGLNLYVRGAVSELWAYALLPLPFYGLYKLYSGGRYRYFCVAVISVAAIILSHNLTALMIMPFLGVVVLLLAWQAFVQKKAQTGFLLISSLLLGIGVAGFYFLPALLEMRYTNVSSILGGASNPLDHFVCLSQLWQSQWGFGGSGPGCVDGFSLMLGKLHVATMLAGLLVLLVMTRQKNREKLPMLVAGLVFCAIAIFMTLQASVFIWKSISVLNYLQFPWRFFSIIGLASSFVAGALVYFLNQKIGKYRLPLQYVLVYAAIIVTIIFYGKYFNPQYLGSQTDELSDPAFIAWSTSKISDEYMPPGFSKPKSADQVPIRLVTTIDGTINIVEEVRKTGHAALVLNSEDATIALNIAPFPAWKLYLDDRLVEPRISQGKYEIDIPKGRHTLIANFEQTQVEKAGNSLSMIGVLLLITGIIIAKKRNFL